MTTHDTAVLRRLRRKLEELVGMDETDMLLDRPPGGWSELVTKDHLRLEFAVLESRMDARFAQIDGRFAQIDGRFAEIDGRFTQIDGRFAEIDGRFTQIDGRFTQIEARFTEFDGRFTEFEGRINKMFASQLRWLVGTVIALGAVMVAAVRL